MDDIHPEPDNRHLLLSVAPLFRALRGLTEETHVLQLIKKTGLWIRRAQKISATYLLLANDEIHRRFDWATNRIDIDAAEGKQILDNIVMSPLRRKAKECLL